MKIYKHRKTGEIILAEDLEDVKVHTKESRIAEIERWKEDRIEKFIKSIEGVAKDLINRMN